MINDKKYWHSPCYAIYNFKHLIGKIGVEKAFHCKKELEAYISALTLLAINHIEGEPWWLQVPESDPPDILAGYWFIKNDGGGGLAIQEIEVFRIEGYTQEKISNAIKRKLHNKAYAPKTTLVGLINRDQEIADLRIISKEVKETKPKISSIWLVGNVDDITQSTYLIFQVFPELKINKIKVNEECERLKPHGHLMRTTWSSKKGTAIKSSIPKQKFPLLIPNGSY